MKIENVASPTPSAPTPPAGQSARDRAIAKLTQATSPAAGTPEQAQATPVANPNAVSAEELTALSTSKGQSDTSEAPAQSDEATKTPETEAKAKEPSDPLSQHYSTLARKEKQLRAKVQAQDAAFKAREDALAAKEATILAREQEYQTQYVRKDRFAQDPMSALEEAGMSYDKLTEAAMNQPQDSQTRQYIARLQADMEAKIQAITAKQEQQAKAYEDTQTRAYKQAVEQIRSEAKTMVASDPEFETIQATDSVNDVVDLIERTFKEEGYVMTVAEAAKQVEDYLVEEAMKLAKIKKIQNRLQPKQAAIEPAKQAVEANNPKQTQPIKTLTNAVSTNRPLSAKERAILAFQGKLNKN